MHAAAVVAGDPAALAIERVCERAGVRVVKMQPGNGLKPRDTMAVGAIGAMINRAGEDLAVRALQILANADPAPISASQIKAVEQLLTSPEYVGQVDPE